MTVTIKTVDIDKSNENTMTCELCKAHNVKCHIAKLDNNRFLWLCHECQLKTTKYSKDGCILYKGGCTLGNCITCEWHKENRI